MELSAIFGTEDNSSARVQYHPWETKYNQICTRGIMRKAMEKEPYTVTKYLVNHAKECVVTEEECHPVLIPMKAIRIEKLIIRGEDKPAGKVEHFIHDLSLNFSIFQYRVALVKYERIVSHHRNDFYHRLYQKDLLFHDYKLKQNDHFL